MAGITTHLLILTRHVNGLNSLIKRHRLANWIKKDLTICCLQETQLIDRNKHWLRVKGWKKIYHANGSRKLAGVAILSIRQSRLRTYFDQMKQRRTLHTNTRGNTSKGNNNYQSIGIQCQCTQFHQTYQRYQIQGTIRDYFKNLCSNKLENFEEIDKLLDIYNHPKLNQENINHLNRSITTMKLKQQ
jgi:exonuclease III